MLSPLCASLMHLQDRLEQYIQEYLDETDKRKIHHISLGVPGHKCTLLIIDSFRLALSEPENGFTLCIYYSFMNNSRVGKKLINRIYDTGLFDGYIRMDGKQETTVYKFTNNDRHSISVEIKTILDTLYPEVDGNGVEPEVKRVHNWHRLEQ